MNQEQALKLNAGTFLTFTKDGIEQTHQMVFTSPLGTLFFFYKYYGGLQVGFFAVNCEDAEITR